MGKIDIPTIAESARKSEDDIMRVLDDVSAASGQSLGNAITLNSGRDLAKRHEGGTTNNSRAARIT